MLAVEKIEESPVGSAKGFDLNDPSLDPKKLSDISIADLLAKVKGKAEEYIPKSDFSLENVNESHENVNESHENVNEEENQQTSGDFDGVLKEAGILESST